MEIGNKPVEIKSKENFAILRISRNSLFCVLFWSTIPDKLTFFRDNFTSYTICKQTMFWIPQYLRKLKLLFPNSNHIKAFIYWTTLKYLGKYDYVGFQYTMEIRLDALISWSWRLNSVNFLSPNSLWHWFKRSRLKCTCSSINCNICKRTDDFLTSMV